MGTCRRTATLGTRNPPADASMSIDHHDQLWPDRCQWRWSLPIEQPQTIPNWSRPAACERPRPPRGGRSPGRSDGYRHGSPVRGRLESRRTGAMEMMFHDWLAAGHREGETSMRIPLPPDRRTSRHRAECARLRVTRFATVRGGVSPSCHAQRPRSARGRTSVSLRLIRRPPEKLCSVASAHGRSESWAGYRQPEK